MKISNLKVIHLVTSINLKFRYLLKKNLDYTQHQRDSLFIFEEINSSNKSFNL